MTGETAADCEICGNVFLRPAANPPNVCSPGCRKERARRNSAKYWTNNREEHIRKVCAREKQPEVAAVKKSRFQERLVVEPGLREKYNGHRRASYWRAKGESPPDSGSAAAAAGETAASGSPSSTTVPSG